MVYPNGRTIDYSYGSGMSNANAALDQAIGRLDAIVDGANSGDAGQVLQQYSYLGLSTIVAENDPQTGINLTYLGSAGSVGAGGDQYVGLDRFGRVVDQNWVNSATGTSTVDLQYAYDSNGNVLYENNLLDPSQSELFHANSSAVGDNRTAYDPLGRLSGFEVGVLSASGNNGTSGQGSLDTVANPSASQSWNLDSQGNWSSVTTNGTTQTRTANAQNQITSISGSATPTYDANGDMISDQNGNTYTYNAWNQLVAVKNSAGAVIAQYTYDARGYRISETYPQGGTGIPAGTTNYIYYDAQWQAIETRTNGTAASDVTSQMVWSASYINAAVLQDTYSAGVIQPNSRLYFEQDANWNTTAVVGLVSGNWQVVQRYTYSPYGTITVLNADWSTPPTGTTPMVNNLYQGMTLDSVTGLYYERYRNYSPSLGTWISQDPLQYINGANTYQFVMSDPVGSRDTKGLTVIGAGITSGGQFGPVGASASAFFITDGMNSGIAISLGAGGGAGIDASVTPGITASNASNIYDMAGPFSNISAGGGAGFGGVGDAYVGNSPDGPVFGGTVGIGPMVGGGASSSLTDTVVFPLPSLDGGIYNDYTAGQIVSVGNSILQSVGNSVVQNVGEGAVNLVQNIGNLYSNLAQSLVPASGLAPPTGNYTTDSVSPQIPTSPGLTFTLSNGQQITLTESQMTAIGQEARRYVSGQNNQGSGCKN